MAPAPARWGCGTAVFRLARLVVAICLLTLPSAAVPQDSPQLLSGHVGAADAPRPLHPGRHVCTVKKDVSSRVKRFEAFRRPVYQSYAHRCQDKICRGVRVVYETAYRDVSEDESQPDYRCCPGWTQKPRITLGCTIPVCSKDCQNNGTCVQPDQCLCPKGFSGQHCEIDVDECTKSRPTPCSHLCVNSEGSYHCVCRPGYRLAPDLHTCLRKGKNKSLGGKGDIDILARKVSKLEKLFRKSSKYELQTELSDNPSNEELQASFDNLQKKFETMKRYQQERWAKLEEDLERIQPLYVRVDSLEQRVDQCACKCKTPVFSRIYP